MRDPQLRHKVAAYKEKLENFLNEYPAKTGTPRIVFVVNVWHLVGGVLSIAQLVNDLIESGVDVKVVLLNPDGYDTSVELLVEPIFFASRTDFVEQFPDADIVVGTLWSTMYHIMHVFLHRPDFLPAYFVQDFEPLFYPEQNSLMRKHVQDTYLLTPFCFAKTRWICDQIRQTGGTIVQVPPGLDLERFQPGQVGRQKGKRIVLAMLRPSTPRRGAETTVRVLEEVSRRIQDVEIQVFGSDDEELDHLGISFAYANHGVVPNDSLPALYSQADIFLECSDFQGFGRTVVEALACETPCVVTRSGGVEDFCVDGENCLMAEPGDVDALVAALEKLLTDKDLFAGLIRACRQSVLRFDRKCSAAQTMLFFEEIRRTGKTERENYLSGNSPG